MSWEAWGSGDEDDYSHLIEAGWWGDNQVNDVVEAIKALRAAPIYEDGRKEGGVSVEFLMRLTLLSAAAGLDVPAGMVAEAEAHFEAKPGGAPPTGEEGAGPCPPGQHRWVGRQMGGPPDAIESCDWVCYCDVCGIEKAGDD